MGASSSKASNSKIPNKSKADSEDEEFTETVVCQVEEMKDGEMREVNIGKGKALVIRERGRFHAVGPKCTHYGAPLIKGVLANGHIRCPWHGACFSIHSGDIEDFPGLDSIQKFSIRIDDEQVKVKATKSQIETQKRIKLMTCQSYEEEETILIVGGGAASISCAETLRQEGYKGKLIIATKENCLPYDRPKLSKALDSSAEALALRNKDFYSVYDIDIRTNKEAVSVDTILNAVKFLDGESISFDKLFIATGGRPRTLNIPGSDLENVCLLRTPEDANKIAAGARGKNVVIIGTSFIGMETAAYVTGKASSVTVIGHSDQPFQYSLGPQIGAMFKKLHEEKGTKFIAKNSPKEFIGENGKLKEVLLEDGTRLPADICITGIGVLPSTSFLMDSGIELSEKGFVTVDKYMKTSKENIYAGGDIVTFPLFLVEYEQANIQHWQMAHKHGQTAALNILKKESNKIHSVPFFWTMQFGKSLRYTGYGVGFDDVIIKGDLEKLEFVAYYTKGDKVVAVASMNKDPIVAQAADVLLAGHTITKKKKVPTATLR